MSTKIPQKLLPWVEARKKHHLSHAQIQMARELGMKLKSLDKLANCKQQPWKLPLAAFIEEGYYKRFKKSRPENVSSIESRVAEKKKNRTEELAIMENEQKKN